MTKTEIAEIDALVLAFVTEHPSSRAGAVADHLAALPGFKARIAKAWKDGGALTSTKADLLKGDDWAATIASEALQRLKRERKVALEALRWSPTDRGAWPAWAQEATRQGWLPPKGWRPDLAVVKKSA